MQLREEPMKAGNLLGMPIVDLNLGEQVDSVRDVIFDRRASAVLGLEVQQGSWPRKKTWVIPFSAVYSVGEDAVMVMGSRDPGTPDERAGLKEAKQGGAGVVGLPLVAPDGTNLGRIQDVAFDIYTGRVAGYQMGGGPQEFVRVAGGVEVDKKVARITQPPRRRQQVTPQPAEALQPAKIQAEAPPAAPSTPAKPAAPPQPAKQKPSPQAEASATLPQEAAPSPLSQFRPIQAPVERVEPSVSASGRPVSKEPVVFKEPVVKVKLPAQPSALQPPVSQPTVSQSSPPGPTEAPRVREGVHAAAPAADPQLAPSGETAAPQQQVRARLRAVVQRDREQLRGTSQPAPQKAASPASISASPVQASTREAVEPVVVRAQPKPQVQPVSEPPAANPEAASTAKAEGDAIERVKHWLEGSLDAVVEKLEAAERELAATSQPTVDADKSDVAGQTVVIPAKVSPAEIEPVKVESAGTVLANEAGQEAPQDPGALLRQALGWPVAEDVRAGDGQLILPADETVTREALAQAREAGKLPELLAAVRRG